MENLETNLVVNFLTARMFLENGIGLVFIFQRLEFHFC